MNASQASFLLQDCRFPGWAFIVVEHSGGEFSLQGKFVSPHDGVMCTTRKWRLSTHMTRSEIVQTAFKAVVTSAEHQAREFFTYRQRAVFQPHYDVDALWEIAEMKDARKEPASPALRGDDLG